jgi:hypothetical protein
MVRLKAWPVTNGLEHIATTWEISSNKEFTDIIETVKSDSMLNMYYSETTIPSGGIVYVRAMRHFNDENADFWSATVTLENIENDISTMLLTKDVEIDKPSIFVNKEDILNDENTFTISTGVYRGKNDGHGYTHWIIEDVTGKILFSSLYNSENKTEIIIDKTTELKNKNGLVIKAIHCTASGIESDVGVEYVNFGDFNFDLVSDTEVVIPLITTDIVFEKPDVVKPHRLIKIDIRYDDNEDDNGILLTIPCSEDSLTYHLPWDIMQPGKNVYLRIHAYDDGGVYSKIIKVIEVRDVIVADILNEDLDYTKELGSLLTDYETLIPNGVTTKELEIDGKIYLPLFESLNIHKFTMDRVNNKLINTGEVLNGVSLINASDLENTYIKYLSNNKLLIDTINGEGKPIFMVYEHNVYDDTYTLAHSIVRTEETLSVGINNAIVQITPDKFIYIPYGSKDLKVYDIVNNTIDVLNTLPFEIVVNACLVNIQDGRLLIVNKGDYTTKVYSIDKNEFIDGVSVVPGTFVTANLKTVELKNGDTLIGKVEQAEDDINSFGMYFDKDSKDFNEIKIDSEVQRYEIDKLFKTSIVLTTGEVMLSSYVPEDLIAEEQAKVCTQIFS